MSRRSVVDGGEVVSELTDVSLVIISPKDGAHFTLNPKMPVQASSVEPSVSLDKAITQVIRYVNNKPFQVSDIAHINKDTLYSELSSFFLP